MKKIIPLFLILFVIFIYPSSSLKIFEINETEKISLAPEVEDPDADILVYTFEDPLSEDGEWQTTYGDAGNYTSAITVSDGVNEVSEDILIVVNRIEVKPIIDNFGPEEESLNIQEGDSINFIIEASDLNNDELQYKWLVNDKPVSQDEEFLFETGFEDSGAYEVKVSVSDGIFDITREWSVSVNDFNFDDIFNIIKDVTVAETETVSLELPDFKKLGYSYTISEPIGDDNHWKTGYDDAGDYKVTVTAEGKGFSQEKEVNIIVKNKDRNPKFVGLKNAEVNENEELKIELEAEDPDNDEVSFSAEDIPEGARLEGNIFTWTPGSDFVQVDNVFDIIMDKFRILGNSVVVAFVVKSNELSDRENVKITVKNANMPFVLEEISNIEINENERIVIDTKYSDPDNDKVSFSYSGFMSSNTRDTGFDDAGTYQVKVTATDGFFTETRIVSIKINDVNRKPVLNLISSAQVLEGQELRLELSATDPDNNAISYSADNLPEGSRIKENLFVWKPGFEIVSGAKKDFSVDFVASDGTDIDAKRAKITVVNVNQAPKIIDFSNNLVASRNEPVLFKVNAFDPDEDTLTYEWDFGFLDKFESSDSHQRIFTSKGKKTVMVTVSDGFEAVSKVWEVNVI